MKSVFKTIDKSVKLKELIGFLKNLLMSIIDILGNVAGQSVNNVKELFL